MVRERILRIVREMFPYHDGPLDDTTTPAVVVGWDSFAHMHVIVRVEEDFGVTFTTEEIGRVDSVGALIRMVAAKSAAAEIRQPV
jgi:acyl carrier protein